MVHSPINLSLNSLFFQSCRLKPFKQRLIARKLIKDLECHAKINFKNLRSKVAPGLNILGANSLKSVAFCTFASAIFEPCNSLIMNDFAKKNSISLGSRDCAVVLKIPRLPSMWSEFESLS